MIKALMMPVTNGEGCVDQSTPAMAMGMVHVQGNVWKQIELTTEQALAAAEQCPEPNRWFVLED